MGRGQDRGFVKAPLAVTRTLIELATKRDALVLASTDATPRMATSIDQMNPRNRSLTILAEILIGPGMAANSIIAVKGGGPVEDGSDGIVPYRNAHLAGVESELVVESGIRSRTSRNRRRGAPDPALPRAGCSLTSWERPSR